MSETVAESAAAKPPREISYFEQQIFARSPLGVLPTALMLMVILFGSYLLLASLENVATFHWAGNLIAFAPGAWPAFTLSLLVCTILGMQRYARLRERKDFAAYAAILKDGAVGAREATGFVPNDARLIPATLIGVASGCASTAVIFLRDGADILRSAPGVFIWFLFIITAVVTLFTRGFELTRRANKDFRRRLDNDVRIDLLRIDALDVLGRSAARTALIWFTICAVICLFFVGGNSSISIVIALAGCAAMGLWIFIHSVHRVHTLIVAAKRTELERVRCEIDNARHQLHSSADAAARTQGLLAYEARIAAAPEWPFDQTTLVRLGASALILTVPWFGQAVAATVVEHMGGAIH
ncbi:MAG TPA: hypothetical protein VHW02_12915 [Rhizomicrobium sp.]|jgi:hypothetical protein|nr:hypothetical protein [Rhizomicrobium sp.]